MLLNPSSSTHAPRVLPDPDQLARCHRLQLTYGNLENTLPKKHIHACVFYCRKPSAICKLQAAAGGSFERSSFFKFVFPCKLRCTGRKQLLVGSYQMARLLNPFFPCKLRCTGRKQLLVGSYLGQAAAMFMMVAAFSFPALKSMSGTIAVSAWLLLAPELKGLSALLR